MSPSSYDPLPHLLALHNRQVAQLPPFEAQRMRESVLTSSFQRKWHLLQAMHRVHPQQELILSPSSDHHLVLVIGNALRVRLGFNGALQEKRLVRDSAIVIPGGATTQWQWETEEKTATPHAEFLHLYLKPDSFAQVAEELDVAPNLLTLRETFGATDGTLAMLAHGLLEEIQRDAAGSRLYADSLACALAVHLLRGFRDGPTLPRPAGRELTANSRQELTARRIKLARDYMDAHLHTDIALADIANAAGISQYHFSRLFKNATGQAPHQYLICRRIERARQLLQTSSLSIGEIAHALGFNSQNRFNVQFRRHLGMTPSEFRNR